ncbi:hypothetical protein RIVM261_047250 [Rivularia sp. IAM M-261]|nr:hypothetical protein CAL7716_088390 [Calothrix sp. PCC 7716]GJD19769.1 hypothetical protein RIVM261_047250 [Rivularia sp. IAM M-261]
MSISKVKAVLNLNFFALAVFTSGLNIVILQLVVNYGFDSEIAGKLTTIKSVFTIIPSLGSAYILKFGYKKLMLLGLLGVTIASLIIAISKDFWAVVLLFILGGLCHYIN